MSIVVRQTVFLITVGALFCLAVLWMARKKLLSFRFVVGWLVLGMTGIIGGALMFEVKPVSERLGITPTTFGLAVSLIIQVGIAIELSITASRMQKQNRTLAESVAILEDRLTEVERGSSGDTQKEPRNGA